MSSCAPLFGTKGIQIDLGGPVDLVKTLRCGQAFRWHPAPLWKSQGFHAAFQGVIGKTALILAQTAPVTSFVYAAWDQSSGTEEWEVRRTVLEYLSSGDDITSIERSLAVKDPVMRRAVAYSHGLRLLTQDKWETLASYIISINNNIPAIQKVVSYLAQCYGKDVGFGQRSFPSPQELAGQPKGSFRASRCGFRDRYIEDARDKVLSGEIDLDKIATLSTDEARQELMKIAGVGPKVADCVLLFAYHRLDVFPVDVWVARAMSHLYLGGQNVTPKKAREEGIRRFGQLAGYAQEYLFFYARESGCTAR